MRHLQWLTFSLTLSLTLFAACGGDEEITDTGCVSLAGIPSLVRGLPALSGQGLPASSGCGAGGGSEVDGVTTPPVSETLCDDLCDHYEDCDIDIPTCFDQCTAVATTCNAAIRCAATASCESILDGSACVEEGMACQ